MTEENKPEKTWEPEADNSGVPKNFVIRCPRCRWARLSSGVKADIGDLYENNQSGWKGHVTRNFRCPKCGTPAPMTRIKGR